MQILRQAKRGAARLVTGLLVLSSVAGGASLAVVPVDARAETLDARTAKAFRRIAIAPEQTEAWVQTYEQFLRDRNEQITRALDRAEKDNVPGLARRRANQAAKRSVWAMRSVLSEEQLKHYAAYLELANELFLREAGLR